MSTAQLTYLRHTFLELGDGFHFSSPPPDDIGDSRYLRSRDAWEVLGCVLARAQRGQFDDVELLIDVMRQRDSAGVWHACAQLLGFAGRRQILERLATQFADRFNERGVQFHVSSALTNGCRLWCVPHLLAMHAVASDDDARIHLERCLSHLVESGAGPVWAGAPKITVVDENFPPPFTETSIELDRKSYAALVEARVAELRSLYGPDDRLAIAEGGVFELESFARGMLQTIASGLEDLVEWERMLFEATTGVSCHGFFGPDRLLRPLAAAAIVEEFLDSGAASRFQQGARYFFGHRIPE
jgi:hypothetical protein